jgi:hypothetical protein
VPTPCTTTPGTTSPSAEPADRAQPDSDPSRPGRPGNGSATPAPDPAELAGDAWQRQVIADAAHLLHPGALIVAITAGAHPAPGTGAFDDPAGRIIAAARETGLTYLQHIVAVHADLSNGHLTLPDTPTGPAPALADPPAPTDRSAGGSAANKNVTASGTTDPGQGPRHRRAHLDLLVLTVPGGTRDA